MKASREAKRLFSILRRQASKSGKRNGVIPGAWLDSKAVLKLERSNKTRRSRASAQLV